MTRFSLLAIFDRIFLDSHEDYLDETVLLSERLISERLMPI